MTRQTLISSAIDLAHAVVAGADVRHETLDALDRHLGADNLASSLALGHVQDGAPAVVVEGTAPLTEHELAEWARLLPSHPYARYVAAGPMAASRLTDHVELSDFESSELFQSLLSPRGSRYQACLPLDRTDGRFLVASLYRAGEDFTDVELEELERVRALLAAAYALRAELDGALAVTGTPEARAGLTPRQVQVAGLVAQGLTNAQLARRLGIMPRTARKHVEDLFARTGCTSRTALAVWWRQGGSSATGERPASPTG